LYWTNENPTKLYYQRQELLLRKAQHARLARELHREHQKFSSGTRSMNGNEGRHDER
jgi:hypothetical protein